jgi:hypothetical protein
MAGGPGDDDDAAVAWCRNMEDKCVSIMESAGCIGVVDSGQ